MGVGGVSARSRGSICNMYQQNLKSNADEQPVHKHQRFPFSLFLNSWTSEQIIQVYDVACYSAFQNGHFDDISEHNLSILEGQEGIIHQLSLHVTPVNEPNICSCMYCRVTSHTPKAQTCRHNLTKGKFHGSKHLLGIIAAQIPRK